MIDEPMRCPYCGGKTRVTQVFGTGGKPVVRRRRICRECRAVFRTVERVRKERSDGRAE